MLMKKIQKKKNNAGFTLVELIVVLVILTILAAILVPALLGYIDEAKDKQYLLDAKNLFNATQAKLSEIYAKRGPYKSLRYDPTNAYQPQPGEEAYNVVENGRGKNADLAWIQDYSFSRDIFKLAGYNLSDPHPGYSWYQKNADRDTGPVWNISSDSDKDKVSFLCVGVGHYDKYAGSSDSSEVHKAYTAYFMIYQPYESADYYLFDGTKFIDEWPYSTKIASAGNNNINNRFKYTININGENITIQFLVLKTVTNYKNATGDLNKIDSIYFP